MPMCYHRIQTHDHTEHFQRTNWSLFYYVLSSSLYFFSLPKQTYWTASNSLCFFAVPYVSAQLVNSSQQQIIIIIIVIIIIISST
jgi:hypothetical protein